MWTGYRQDRDPGDGDLDRHSDSIPNCNRHADAFGNTNPNTNTADTDTGFDNTPSRKTPEPVSFLFSTLADHWIAGLVHGDCIRQRGGSPSQGVGSFK